MQTQKPKITIVTPSYNQGQFLEETIDSVLGQGYENLEYIIIDGGSSDESVNIIKKHEKHLTYWQSQRDNGQSSAINLGFSKATGDIQGWLNSDDTYLPGALNHASKVLSPGKNELLFGNCVHLEEGKPKCSGSNVEKAFEKIDLKLNDFIIQPSSFWTSQCWSTVGPLDEGLHYAFDWDWFIRAQLSGTRFKPTFKYLSTYRIHDGHKTGTGGSARSSEIIEIYRRYAGEQYAKAAEIIARKESFLNSLARAQFLPANSRLDLLKPLLFRVSPYLFKFLFPETLKHLSIKEVMYVSSMV